MPNIYRCMRMRRHLRDVRAWSTPVLRALERASLAYRLFNGDHYFSRKFSVFFERRSVLRPFAQRLSAVVLDSALSNQLHKSMKSPLIIVSVMVNTSTKIKIACLCHNSEDKHVSEEVGYAVVRTHQIIGTCCFLNI
jgi:hypothetical protein